MRKEKMELQMKRKSSLLKYSLKLNTASRLCNEIFFAIFDIKSMFEDKMKNLKNGNYFPILM